MDINEIKNTYWKIETISKKHRKAHLAAEIYFCAHIFISLFMIIVKLCLESDYLNNPPSWLGILFPLLTIGKYPLNRISVPATILCFVLVPLVISALVYFLLAITFRKKYSINKNPYKNMRSADLLEKCYRFKLTEPNAVRALKNHIHRVVWIQVLCFAVLFTLLVIIGAIQKLITSDEVLTGIVSGVLAAPAYSIVLYVLRWFEYRLFIPMDRIFNATYKARIKKPINSIKESSLYTGYVQSENDKYHAKLRKQEQDKIREERNRREYQRIAKEHVQNSPVFLDDLMRIRRDIEAKNKPVSNPDSMGIRDGVPVDGRGM